MRAWLLALLMLHAVRSLAQDASLIPGMTARLAIAVTDSDRIDLLNELCFHNADKDPSAGVAYGEQALALALRTGNAKGVADAHNRMGYCHVRLSEFRTADSLCLLAVKEYGAFGDRCGLALSLMNYGLSKEMRQDHAGALEQFQRALDEGEACPLKNQRSALLYTIGGPYERLGRYEDALRTYRLSFAIDSAAHDSARLAKNHIAIANMLAALKRIDEAMGHYQRSIQCSQAIGDTLMTGYVWYNCAEIEQGRGDQAHALDYGERAVAVFEQLHRSAELLHTEILLGRLYTGAGRNADAMRTLTHALRLAHDLGIMEERLQVLHALADLHKAQGDPQLALQTFEAYLALKDSIAADAQQSRLAELTEKYESEKKDKELVEARATKLALESDAERQRTLKLVYLISAVALALLLTVSISRYRLKRRTAEELSRTNAEVVKQKERAEESERAKDRFLANVSHEIRTPLNAIMGFTGLLLHEHRDERTARFLTNIREAGDNLLVVINDVLDLSRIEAGRLQLVKETFDLHRVVKLCTEILHHRAEEQGNELSSFIDPDVPPWASGDSARVLQILLNLAGNALKFTSNGEVRIEVARRSGQIQLAVIDSGLGIPQDKLATIFDRFTQVEVTDQRRYGGTGLGLAIVKELVDLHGGTITVESMIGRGTTFTVLLPLEPAEAPARTNTRTEELSSASLSGHTILVAEDNEMNALVTTETMRRYYPNATVVVVRNGKESLARIEADLDHDIALVLMDVQMPVMDGMAATRHIRAMDGPVAHLPIIALTASVLPNDLSKCLDAGMDACVSKPFKADELVRAIGTLTGDHGAPAGVGYDLHDPHVALFHWLVPPRLKALRVALEEGRSEELLHTVHALRPQLVERDAVRFAPLCDRILDDRNASDLNTVADELISAIEAALA
ncbi:MAG: tetratricopeptide repeat protein [Flavobacteriales bacterium]|nr:tetratricopeptide repeat protein [Flavobacteriales bacterium]